MRPYVEENGLARLGDSSDDYSVPCWSPQQLYFCTAGLRADKVGDNPTNDRQRLPPPQVTQHKDGWQRTCA